MKNDSRVAIIMSVHRAADYGHFRLSMSSILSQTYKNWVIFLFCDGALSTEMDNYIETIPQTSIRIVRSMENVGLAEALNCLIEIILAEGGYTYLMRMDADDVCLPQRMEHQVCFLDENPALGIVGTWCREIDDNGELLFEKRLPTQNQEMIRFMAIRSPLVHPTVMARLNVFSCGVRYSPELRKMQDYDLWSRLFFDGVQMANLPEFLLEFRVSNEFFTRRCGWRRALPEILLRVKHMQRFRLFSLKNIVLLGCFFMLRIAPQGFRRFAYYKLR